VFLVSLVKPYISYASFSRVTPPPPVQGKDGEAFYIAESLLDQFAVFKGRDKICKSQSKRGGEQNTWEPESKLIGRGDMVRKYKALKNLQTRTPR